jgi:hypothetical protein
MGQRASHLISAAFVLGAASSASAEVDPGTMVRAIPASGSSSAITSADAASGPGAYRSDLAGTPYAGRAFAQLDWADAAVSFTGLANGGSDAMMRTQGIAVLELAQTMQVDISWSMALAVGAGIETSWGLLDASGDGTPTVGVTATEGVLVSFGGVRAIANGSFSGTVASGTYVLVMLSEATASAGQVELAASFTAVPAPSAVLVLPAAAWAAMGRVRRR